jgi:hypothetical protein
MKTVLKRLKPEDEVFLFNLCSKWDLLDEEKNSGIISLYEQESYLNSSGFPNVHCISADSWDIRAEALR